MSKILLNRLPLWKGQTHRGVRKAPVIMEKIIRSHVDDIDIVVSGGISENIINWFDNIQETIYHNSLNLMRCYEDKDLIINLGGDHAIAMGTIPPMVLKYPTIKVVWIDAHADIHSPDTSVTGNSHGMPLYFASELSNTDYKKISLDNLHYYGIRDLDDPEIDIIKKHNIKNFTSDQVNMRDRSDDIIEWLGSDPIHLSIDVDGLDPSVFPSTGTTAGKGLNLHHVLTLIEKIKKTKNLVSVDLVEFNPDIGNSYQLAQSICAIDKIVERLVRLAD